MKVSIRAIAALALVALLAPAAARCANEARVNGPATLAGQRLLRRRARDVAARTASGRCDRPAAAATSAYSTSAATQGALPRLGPSSRRRRPSAVRRTSAKGRGGQAIVLGSHCHAHVALRSGKESTAPTCPGSRLRGTFHGRFVLCAPTCRGRRGEGPARPTRPTREPGAGRAQAREGAPVGQEDEEIPTVDELVALLGGDE